MPIYEYECKNCHHHFDLMQKISDAPAKQCPQCFQDTAVRLVSAAGFQLKGTGWYVTDFKNKGSKTETKSDSSTTAPENKPAESTATKSEKKGDKD
ncbi:FmdB family zinc ribbon protein [Legionella cardiaca]|uniref:Zinc ribbon domain-containing protein n=1 Tax=Legionella cardiaca TaxID=1071983 RepID=A0ABY8AX42_9GAMM|nr:zinc ribbon domain-containing protein [Legionella cardiaca]WED44296.1 zinc ribbon domain-containing protein [Legionella cardiaca]